MKSGMKFLIESFYRSIAEGAPDPIPPREILLTARIMENIFNALNAPQSDRSSHSMPLHTASANVNS